MLPNNNAIGLLLHFLSFFCTPSSARIPSLHKQPQYQTLPSLREQAKIQDSWRDERVLHVPQILQKYHVDAWLLSQREYAEDTAFWSMKSAEQFSSRRRTTTLFVAGNDTEDGRSSSDQFYYNWIDNTPKVWTDLLEVLEERQPGSIVVDVHSEIAFSGGLHAGEYEAIVRQLGPQWAKKLVVEPMVAVEYIGMMPESRLGWYRKLMETAWAMISEAFSEQVIVPGVSTIEDVNWWLRDKIQQQNYSTWFMPDVTVVDENSFWLSEKINPSVSSAVAQKPVVAESNLRTKSNTIIRYGDYLHVDFGVTAMGLNTDTQHLAYVLHPGQNASDVPQGLRDGLKKVNRLQDIVKANMRPGLTGNEVLTISQHQMKKEGIEGKIYCHPIGDWGHSAGSVIGMTNLQNKVPVLGDMPILSNTWYSVELYASHFVPESGVTLPFYQEEDVYWNSTTEEFEWVHGRQEDWHVIRPER